MQPPVFSPNLSPIPLADVKPTASTVPGSVASGRRRHGYVGSATIAATVAPFIGANYKRVSLRLFSNSANRITISDNPNVALDNGINLQAAGTQISLNIEIDGDIVTKQLFAIASAGGSAMGFVETSLED